MDRRTGNTRVRILPVSHEEGNKLSWRELLNQSEKMKKIASKDALTGLLNRTSLEEEINRRLERMNEMDTSVFFLVDLDNFKSVNDIFGKQSGDRLLARAAQILSDIFRSTDLVGRLGGDKFGVFLCGSFTEEMIRSKGQMISDQVQFAVGMESDCNVTASVGIYMSAKRKSFADIYQAASRALREVKRNGKQGYHIWQNEGDGDFSREEEAILKNVKQLRPVLENINSGVAMLDAKESMKFLYLNRAFAHMLGMKMEELSNLELMYFIYSDDREKLESLLADSVLKRGKAVISTVRVSDRENRILQWKVYASCVEYKKSKPVILLVAVDITEEKDGEPSLGRDKSLFQAAVNQAVGGMWEVDCDSRSFRLIGQNDNFSDEMTNLQSFPEGLLEQNWIHPECKDGFQIFAKELLCGKQQGYANFKVRFRDSGTYRWVAFSYRLILDERGCPVRALGIIEGPVPERKDGIALPKRMMLPEGLSQSLIFQMKGNLSRDILERYWTNEDDGEEKVFQTCSKILAGETEKAFVPEKGKRFTRFLSKDALLLSFVEKGTRWDTYEYRRVDQKGNIGWVSCTINLYRKNKEKDVHLALWMCSIDERYHLQARYGISIYRAPMTKLYTRETLGEIMKCVLKEKEHKLCALVMVEIGGMAKLYANDSGSIEEKRRALVTAMVLAAGTKCIPGQYGTDRFLFFFPKIKNEKNLKRNLEQVLLFARNATSDIIEGNLFRFLVTGICRYKNETDYGTMLNKVRVLGQIYSKSPGDRVVIVGKEEDRLPDSDYETREDGFLAFREESLSPLSDEERNVAFSCILEMLNLGSLEDSSMCMLRVLGAYYDADRTYILVPAEDVTIVTMFQEWTSIQRNSIRHVVSGMTMEKFPLLERCIREDRPIFLTKKGQKAKGYDKEEKEKKWRFGIFPMRDSGHTAAYLCIENPREHIQQATLPSLLSSCLLKEWKKIYRNSRNYLTEGMTHDMELPNQNFFLEAIPNYTSDIYSSLGVVSVDIPEYSILNSKKGFDYGRKILWYVIQMITDIFGRERLYRTWDAEFVVLSPNTTQQIFYEKCLRLHGAFTKRFPGKVRLGYTWSDHVFNGKALVEEAKAIMGCHRPTRTESRDENLPGALAGYESIKEMIQNGRFTVYFQPKIDMEKGCVAGAEALVRGIDKEGNIIPPSQFVDEFEKDGSIRELDLFVLNYTMKTMDAWRESGEQLIPVSTNFSRATLFSPNIGSAVLAIQSRYPKLPLDMVEVEITESAGDVSHQTLANAMEKLRDYGMTFSLDDFGSKYSNLAIFTNVPFESVKIDRSLISDIMGNEGSQSIVRDIVNICRSKEIRCVVEGVETEDQEAVLLGLGCTYAQGYYYDRPLSEEKFYERYIKNTIVHRIDA